MFLKNLELKRLNKDFQLDMNILLPQGGFPYGFPITFDEPTNWNFDEAFEYVTSEIINRI